MDVTFESSPDHPMLARRAAILSRPTTQAHRMADAIRALARDAADPSGSGCSAPPMGMADVATALWTRFHKFDAADPHWPDRDRFVLCAGHSTLLLSALNHLTGHASQPDYDQHPAVEATAGAAGHGLATAVGMALAERNMAARFGKSLVDHRTWVIASDADLMDGVSHEAASLAGQLGLSKLAVLYDDRYGPTSDDPDPSYGEDLLKRFTAYGWATRRVDGHDPDQISAALSFAVRSRKPTLIACRTNPGATLTAESHVPHDDRLLPQDDLTARWHAAGARGATARRSWLKRLARHAQRGEFERVIPGRLPDSWHEAVIELKQQIADDRPMRATATASQQCLELLVPVIPELIGGSAGPPGSHATPIRELAPISAGHYGGRALHYGVRAHGMAATSNGMALHGGIIPYIATGFAFADDLRPALRLAAIMRQRVIYALTQDTSGLTGDGTIYVPVEQLAGLRAMPNLHVFRPADTMETAECWELALRRTDGPSLLVLSQQSLPAWRTDPIENRCARGGYVLAEADGPRQATIIATGPEVAIAMSAREKLAGDSIAVAVVSLPCWELFAQQDEAFRAEVLGGAPRVGIEAAGGFGWEQWLGHDGTFIGMAGFAPVALAEDLYRQFGVAPEAVVAAITRRLA